MSKENLTCEMCDSSWSRKKSRGRKPRFCPQCIKDNVVLSESIVVMSDTQKAKAKTATKWICPKCSETVTVFVQLIYPPTCSNKMIHSTKVIEMEPLKRQKEIYA